MSTDRELRDLLEALQVEVRQTRQQLADSLQLLSEERARFTAELAGKGAL